APMREFLWSEDMADACVFLLENYTFRREDFGKEAKNFHVNIGTGIDLSIKELAELVQNTIGFEGELYFNADKPDGTMKKLTDPSKLHAYGWKHSVELAEGVKRLFEFYRA
ncbi:MAG: hypothetical protein RIS47_1089, partial [Bacteroidota bacterium]